MSRDIINKIESIVEQGKDVTLFRGEPEKILEYIHGIEQHNNRKEILILRHNDGGWWANNIPLTKELIQSLAIAAGIAREYGMELLINRDSIDRAKTSLETDILRLLFELQNCL